MVRQHKEDTKEFRALSFTERANSITATIDDLQAAIEHYIEHSPRRLETMAEYLAQVDRLRWRLRDAYEQQRGHVGSRQSVAGAEDIPRLRIGSPRLAEPERASDFVPVIERP